MYQKSSQKIITPIYTSIFEPRLYKLVSEVIAVLLKFLNKYT